MGGELALQGNIVQARAGQGLQVQARTYIQANFNSNKRCKMKLDTEKTMKLV